MKKNTPAAEAVRALSIAAGTRSITARDGDRQAGTVIAFPNHRAVRERLLLQRATAGLAELGAVVGELADLRGSVDGSAMLGPSHVPGADDLEAFVHVRRRRL